MKARPFVTSMSIRLSLEPGFKNFFCTYALTPPAWAAELIQFFALINGISLSLRSFFVKLYFQEL